MKALMIILASTFFVSLNAQAAPTANGYMCKKNASGVCAVRLATGQCTHSWDRDDVNDPMWSCRKFLGLVKSNFDKSNFRCKKTASGYCAQSLKTGQCTHEWYHEDGNAKWQCNNWLRT